LASSSWSCPPYSWSVSGTGFELDKETTNSDYETNTLSALSSACGSATIEVTDECGEKVNSYVRCTVGNWDWVGMFDCYRPACWCFDPSGESIEIDPAHKIKINATYVDDSNCRGFPHTVTWAEDGFQFTIQASDCPGDCDGYPVKRISSYTKHYWQCP